MTPAVGYWTPVLSLQCCGKGGQRLINYSVSGRRNVLIFILQSASYVSCRKSKNNGFAKITRNWARHWLTDQRGSMLLVVARLLSVRPSHSGAAYTPEQSSFAIVVAVKISDRRHAITKITGQTDKVSRRRKTSTVKRDFGKTSIKPRLHRLQCMSDPKPIYEAPRRLA